MKFFQFYVPFLVLIVCNSTLNINFILKNDKKLSNYVCKVTKDIISSKSDTKDVLIGNLGGKVWSSTVNDIAGCVGQDSAVVASDFKEPLTVETLRKAIVIILAVGYINKVD
ncbi:unnamed protein product [Chironomus riparius]|uniref:Uncharacterized protein n=1 Tax=Chironomus riparius TaxID=315576 RepID=A0A9N9S6J6_9DIPT|nr:unnamed protein product [Chironomus riparius]